MPESIEMNKTEIYSHFWFKLKRFPVYKSDVFVVSYPRSGNTWLRYLLTNLLYPDSNGNYDLVAKTVIDYYVNRSLLKLPAPVRFIKSHEPYTKRYPKVVYIYRDGRDVSGSYYRFYKKFNGFDGSFSEFLDLSFKGKIRFGSWHTHIESWLMREHDIPFLPIKYEALLSDPLTVIHHLSDFLELQVNDVDITKALEASSIRSQYIQFTKKHYGKNINPQEIKNNQYKWIDHFNGKLQDYFFEKAGKVMERLGYEKYDFSGS